MQSSDPSASNLTTHIIHKEHWLVSTNKAASGPLVFLSVSGASDFRPFHFRKENSADQAVNPADISVHSASLFQSAGICTMCYRRLLQFSMALSLSAHAQVTTDSFVNPGLLYDSAASANASSLLEEILAGRNDAAYLYGYALPGADLSDSLLLALEQAGLPAGFKSIALKNELGRIYLDRGNLQKADSLIQVAIRENRLLSGSVKNPEIIMSYYYKSRLVRSQGLLNEAIGWVNKAMEEAHFGFEANNLFDMPDNVALCVSPQAFFRTIRLKASLLFEKYQSEKKTIWLEQSVMAYVKAIELNRYILRNLDDANARRFYTENSKTLYDEAIPVAYLLTQQHEKHLPLALFMLESYKGSELANHLRNAQIRLRSNVPASL